MAKFEEPQWGLKPIFCVGVTSKKVLFEEPQWGLKLEATINCALQDGYSKNPNGD